MEQFLGTTDAHGRKTWPKFYATGESYNRRNGFPATIVELENNRFYILGAPGLSRAPNHDELVEAARGKKAAALPVIEAQETETVTPKSKAKP
jgi:hypothetical protein